MQVVNLSADTGNALGHIEIKGGEGVQTPEKQTATKTNTARSRKEIR
jgi:hypothetical protein